MANNYSSLVNERASKKFILARVEPARYITDDLALDSGTTYTATLPFETVSKLKVNGTYYTKVSSAPSASQFSYDETTKEISVNLGGVLGSERIIVYHYLFFSSLDSVFAHEEPYAGTGTIRLWENRIKNDPSLSNDLSNVQQGYIKTSNVNLNLENIDSFIDQYLTSTDSFSSKEIKIWHCINDVENIAKFYTGKITSLNVASTLSISTDNAFQALENQAFFEGISDNAYYDQNLDSPYTYVIPEAYGKPLQQIYGEISTHDVVNSTQNNFVVYTDPSSPYFNASGDPVIRNTYEAVNIDFTEKTGGKPTVNYNWCLYKSDTFSTAPNPEQDHSESISAVSSVDAVTYDLTVADSSKYLPFDEVFINPTTYLITESMMVTQINSSTSIRVRKDLSGPTPVATDTIVRKEVSCAFLVDPALTAKLASNIEVYNHLSYGTHFTLVYSATANYVTLRLDSNISNAFLYPTYSLDVSADSKIYYRRWSTDSYNHGDVVQRLLENAGLTVNAASIATANATTINCNFGIPLIGESEIKSTRYYLERILESTNGYLLINEDNEVEYHLIDSPSSTSEITEDKVLLGSFSKKITYSDIVNQITVVNKHGYTDEMNSLDTKNTGTFSNDKSKELHDVTRAKVVNHVLESGTYIQNNYMDIKAERKQLSTYKIKEGFTDLIGDDVKYNFKNETNSETIIKTSKNSKEQTITTTDFLGA